MSTALAIAGVTAVMRKLLGDWLVSHDVRAVVGGDVIVSALPPDRVTPASGGVESNQINIFLHQVTHNTGWRNEGLPSRDATGAHRLSNPPLALDLHYLISTYGAADLHAEILLGHVMQLLHEHPVFERDVIRAALTPSGTPPPALLVALASCGLADQIEQIRITPMAMGSEEMSRFWSAQQTHYRPTAAYQASVVLIESVYPTRATLPVLSRGPVVPESGREQGVVVQPDLLPPLPFLQTVFALGGEPVARLDDVVSLNGFHLDGSAREVLLENERLGIAQVLPATGVSAAGLLQFTVPAARSADFPVGLYQVSARLVRTDETEPRQTNHLGLMLVPWITGLPIEVTRDNAGTARFTLNFTPYLRAGQTVVLIFGQREVMPESFTAPTNVLSFVITNAPVGNHLARLRIDSIESPIINRAATPPVFFNQRINIL